MRFKVCPHCGTFTDEDANCPCGRDVSIKDCVIISFSDLVTAIIDDKMTLNLVWTRHQALLQQAISRKNSPVL